MGRGTVLWDSLSRLRLQLAEPLMNSGRYQFILWIDSVSLSDIVYHQKRYIDEGKGCSYGDIANALGKKT
jgi:hypothetical protein